MAMSQKRGKIYFIAAGIALILSLNFFQTEVKGFFYNISLPVQKWLWEAGEGLGVIPRTEDLQKENEEIRLINQELMAEIIGLWQAREENIALREALLVGLNEDLSLEMAQVIGKDINQDSLFIDKGSKDGLSQGMPVVTGQKVALGRISEVYPYRSKVMLISDKNSSFDAEMSSSSADRQESGVSGLLRGEGGGRIIISLLPKDAEINEGDLVVSSLLGGIFPSGLLMGTIKSVEKNDIDPFQKAEVSAFFSLSDLKQVFVILDF